MDRNFVVNVFLITLQRAEWFTSCRTQCPNCVQVVGEEDDGVHFKRPLELALPDGVAEQRTVVFEVKQFSASMSDDGEEEGSSGDVGATIVGHR